MTIKRTLTAATTALAVALTAAPAAFADSQDGAARVDMAGKLRMLSQRIPASMCNLEAGIETETATQVMNAAASEFDRIAAALVYGDPGLKIYAPEKDPLVLADIATLQGAWGPIRARVFSMQARFANADDISAVAIGSEDLLSAAKQVVVSVRSDDENANPIPQAWALTIDIAGRQRMLAQRMSKNACLLASGQTVTDAAAELGGVMETYGASLWALRFGMKDAGVISPPNADIGTRLEDIAVDWATLAPILASVRNGAEIDDETRAQLYLGLNALTGKMNTVVGLYVQASAVTS